MNANESGTLPMNRSVLNDSDQVRSFLSLTSYLATEEYRDRYLGVRIPTTNVQPEQLEQTRTFASALADRIFGRAPARPGEKTAQPR